MTLSKSSNNTSLIQQQYHSQFQSSLTIKLHPISQKHNFLLKTSMQQGQTYITIVGFADPNFGVKAVNQNKLPSPIVISPSTPFYIVRRSLAFMFVGPNAESYIPYQRQFSILKFWYWGQMSYRMSRHRASEHAGYIWQYEQIKQVNNTRELLTQFGATSPTSGGYQAREEIH